DYIIKKSGKDLAKLFDQYLRDTRIPVLEYKIENSALSYRWTECASGFNMTVRVFIKDKPTWLKPTEVWQTLKIKDLADKDFSADKNFYIHASKSTYTIPKISQ